MRFQTKILLSNIVVVTLAFIISGLLMIRNEYHSSIEKERQSESQKIMLASDNIKSEIINMILKDTYTGMESLRSLSFFHSRDRESEYYLLADDLEIICQKDQNNAIETGTKDEVTQHSSSIITEELQHSFMEHKADITSVQYLSEIVKINNTKQLITVCPLKINDTQTYLISSKDITSLYQHVEDNIVYFRIMTVIAVGCSCILLYFVSSYLSSSVKALNHVATEMGTGNYAVRSSIVSKDEIGELADTFNGMADKVESQIDMLRSEAQKKEEFVASFTHEIKTPMTSIIGFAETIRMDVTDQETVLLGADYIYNEGMRLEQLSMKLFDLLLLDHSKLKLEHIQVSSMMNEIVAAVQPDYDRQKLIIEVHTIDAWLHGDYDLLKTVFINFLDNARKASAEEQKIVFSCNRDTDENEKGVLVFQVADQGIGIPPEDLDKITDVFYMVDKSRSRRQGGAGIGMALAYKIIQLHHGVLHIKSKPSFGTTVETTFMEDRYEA